MQYSFDPEPEPAEREALELALDRLLTDELVERGGYRSAWRRAALEEAAARAYDDDDGNL